MRRARKLRSLPQRVLLGAIAGFGGTMVMQGMMTLSAKTIPSAKPPIKQDPGEFMIGKVKEHIEVPEAVAKAAAKSLHLGYGMTSGVLYSALRNRAGSNFLDGAILGLGVWASGYLGWLPATELMPPITQQRPEQVIVPIVQHAIFGIAVVAAYDSLMRV
jgi:hypothetical protein